MGWREKTTHMHSHVHAHITHTCDILTTHKDVHTCTDSASDVSSTHTHTKAQTTHLLISSQAHTDTTKLCSHISQWLPLVLSALGARMGRAGLTVAQDWPCDQICKAPLSLLCCTFIYCCTVSFQKILNLQSICFRYLWVPKANSVTIQREKAESVPRSYEQYCIPLN